MDILLDTLASLEGEIHHAGNACSRQRLEQLLHARFHEVGRSGNRYDRSTVINYLAALTDVPDTQSSAHALMPLAEGLCLMTFMTRQRVRNDQCELPAHRSSIWTRSGGHWQLIYHQATPAAVE